MKLAPGLGIALGDSLEVAHAPGAKLADARVATAEPVLTAGAAAAPSGRSIPLLAVSPNRVVARAEPVEEPPTPATPQPATQQPPAPLVPPASAQPEPVQTAVVPSPVPRIVASSGVGQPGWTSAVGGVGSGVAGSFQIREGGRYALAFSLYIEPTVYGVPGSENRFVRLRGDAAQEPSFGLQLWDHPGGEWGGGLRGIWASGVEMGGDRFLAPVAERAWHEVAIHFLASGTGAGFYEVYLDGQPIDARSGVSVVAPGSSHAQIEVGLFRDGVRVHETHEIRIDAVRLGGTLESVLP